MFKYNNEILGIQTRISDSCTSNCYPKDLIAFRWVFPDNRPDNFLPRALINHNGQELTKNRCNGWSLSMFDTEENAINELNCVYTNRPNIFKKLGTHVAKGNINPDDGLVSPINAKGHFEFFEFENSNIEVKFVTITMVCE